MDYLHRPSVRALWFWLCTGVAQPGFARAAVCSGACLPLTPPSLTPCAGHLATCFHGIVLLKERVIWGQDNPYSSHFSRLNTTRSHLLSSLIKLRFTPHDCEVSFYTWRMRYQSSNFCPKVTQKDRSSSEINTSELVHMITFICHLDFITNPSWWNKVNISNCLVRTSSNRTDLHAS